MNILPILIAIGTYTANTDSQGIYLLELDIEKQQSQIVNTFAAQNPSFLQYSAHNNMLYYVEEIGAGTVNSVPLNPEEGSFGSATSLSTQGGAPCHITMSPDHTTLLASNYSGGNLATFALAEDGTLTHQQAVHAFYASSVVPHRQKQSHIHSAFYSPDATKVFVQDLGGDHIYQFDANTVTQETPNYLTHKMVAGSGPRHLTFSPDQRFVYILNELAGTVDVHALNDSGEIDTHLQNIATDDREGESWCAEIRLSPDGKFLYASNRAEKNSISVFGVAKDGTLQLLQVTSSEGKGPRHFEFSSDGNWVIVAHQQSNNISIFARDASSGLLTFSGMKVDIPSPVCVAVL